MSSSVNSVASSTHMSVMPAIDLIFSESSMPLNRRMDPFGSSIVKVDLLMLLRDNKWNCDNVSITSCQHESFIVDPTFLMMRTLRMSVSALIRIF